jgi:hypothetical protein
MCEATEAAQRWSWSVLMADLCAPDLLQTHQRLMERAYSKAKEIRAAERASAGVSF